MLGGFMPEFLYPRDPAYVVAAILLGVLLDIAYPYHSGLALRLHPVHTAFIMARVLGKPGSSRIRGVATWFAVMVTHLIAYGAVLWVAWLASPIAWVLAAAYVIKVSAPIKLLLDTVKGVYEAASRGNWAKARELTQGIVRRDVHSLDEGHVLSAAVESLAESLVDGFTSPLLYVALLGPLGGLAQRIANTLDGALGFKEGGYADVGWFSAKVDTLLNYVPARLTATLITLLAPPVTGAALSGAVRCWLRNARVTESVNAGHPMAAMAAVLGITLEKVGHYTISCGNALPRPEHVRVAVKCVILAATTWLALMIMFTLVMITMV